MNRTLRDSDRVTPLKREALGLVITVALGMHVNQGRLAPGWSGNAAD